MRLKVPKRCWLCHGTGNLHIHARHPNSRVAWVCRKCSRKRAKAYRMTESGRDSIRKAHAKYYAKIRKLKEV